MGKLGPHSYLVQTNEGIRHRRWIRKDPFQVPDNDIDPDLAVPPVELEPVVPVPPSSGDQVDSNVSESVDNIGNEGLVVGNEGLVKHHTVEELQETHKRKDSPMAANTSCNAPPGVQPTVTTRCGRVSKKPVKLDL